MFAPITIVLAALKRLFTRPGTTTTPVASPPRAAPARAARTRAGTAAGAQTLWCEPGAHNWTRPAKPGRKPKACARHA